MLNKVEHWQISAILETTVSFEIYDERCYLYLCCITNPPKYQINLFGNTIDNHLLAVRQEAFVLPEHNLTLESGNHKIEETAPGKGHKCRWKFDHAPR